MHRIVGIVVSAATAVAVVGCGGSSVPPGGATHSATTTAVARYATARTQDATAQEQARTAETAAETLATDANGSYASLTSAALIGMEPTLSTTSGGPRLTAARGTATGYTLTTASVTGDTFTITRHPSGRLALTCTGTTTTACNSGTW
jgi:hypothetical protein